VGDIAVLSIVVTGLLSGAVALVWNRVNKAISAADEDARRRKEAAEALARKHQDEADAQRRILYTVTELAMVFIARDAEANGCIEKYWLRTYHVLLREYHDQLHGNGFIDAISKDVNGAAITSPYQDEADILHRIEREHNAVYGGADRPCEGSGKVGTPET